MNICTRATQNKGTDIQVMHYITQILKLNSLRCVIFVALIKFIDVQDNDLKTNYHNALLG